MRGYRVKDLSLTKSTYGTRSGGHCSVSDNCWVGGYSTAMITAGAGGYCRCVIGHCLVRMGYSSAMTTINVMK